MGQRQRGEFEGVLLRNSRNSYMACPPQLATSNSGMACAALEVQVSYHQIQSPRAVVLAMTVTLESSKPSSDVLPVR